MERLFPGGEIELAAKIEPSAGGPLEPGILAVALVEAPRLARSVQQFIRALRTKRTNQPRRIGHQRAAFEGGVAKGAIRLVLKRIRRGGHFAVSRMPVRLPTRTNGAVGLLQ